MKHRPFKCAAPVINPHQKGLEKWGKDRLVQYPVSISYNGGIVIEDEWYSGYEVPPPIVPDGWELVSIHCGLQLNARPPLATQIIRMKK